ncbi:MAG: AAA family ATPase [Methanomassiliicoccales archaeon]
MTFIVAVAGKGGVGKSTLSSLLIKALAERTRTVIMAVDADPNSNLGDKLGMKMEHTIGELREGLLRKAEELSSGVSKHELVRYQMEMAKVEGSNFDLLTMGRPEGRGCYCYINNILRTFIDEAMDTYDYAVIDNEAGMEHLSRRTTKRMDVLLVVSDPTKLGVETAKRILALAKGMEIDVGRSVLVVNRVQGTIGEAVEQEIDTAGFGSVVYLPYDRKVEELAIAGLPMVQLDVSSQFYRAVKDLASSLK